MRHGASVSARREAGSGRIRFGNLLTSLTAGAVVGITMAVLGLPFLHAWALWVVLVDCLPHIGAALAGIPTVLFAAMESVTDAGILAAVFIAYKAGGEPRPQSGGDEPDRADQSAGIFPQVVEDSKERLIERLTEMSMVMETPPRAWVTGVAGHVGAMDCPRLLPHRLLRRPSSRRPA
jgi:hypothetical protein